MTRRLVSFLVAGLVLAADDVARVFRFEHTLTRESVQEISTVVRSIAEIRQAYANAEARSLTAQASPEQVELAEWVVKELDRPAAAQGGASPASFVIHPPNGTAHVVRIFFLPAGIEVHHLQEITTAVRSVGEIRHAFTYNAARAVAVRGTQEQLLLTEWLLEELQKPSGISLTREFRLDSEREGVVQVFHLPQALSIERFQEIARATRPAASIRRLFTFNRTRAIAVRGTAEQVSSAARFLADYTH